MVALSVLPQASEWPSLVSGCVPGAGTGWGGVTPSSCSSGAFQCGTDEEESHCGPGAQTGGQRAVEGADDSVDGLCGGVPFREGPEGQMTVLLGLKGPGGCLLG